MFAAISDWVKHLVFLILLAVLVELVLPQNSLHKYARAVFGLLIVLAMLDPLRALLTAHYSAEVFDQQLQGPLIGSAVSAQSAATVAYEQDLASEIRSAVVASFSVSLQDVQVLTNTASDGSETVTGVYALLPAKGLAQGALLQREIAAQISEMLGLPLTAIHVQ